MNTMTGDFLNNTERYDDEVLNANWLPQMVLAALGLQNTRREAGRVAVGSERDAEDFMQRLYRAQE